MKTIILVISISVMTLSSGMQILNAQSKTNARIEQLGIELPQAPSPVGNYVPFKRVGNMVYINQVALVDGKILHQGIVGDAVTEQQAIMATKQAMLNVIAVLKQAVGGDLDRVKQAVQMTGIFNTPAGYTQHAKLMNAGSDLLVEVFEQRGVHTRATFGTSSIPLGSPVEIQAIFEIE